MQRISSIDFVKSVAVFFVIIIHTAPLREMEGISFYYLDITLTQFARFAVPCFFIFSGYFFGKTIQQNSDILHTFLRYSSRYLIIFIIWSLIYLISDTWIEFQKGYGSLYYLITNKFLSWVTSPTRLFFVGSRAHLWFLPALIYSLAVVSVCVYFKSNKLMYIVACFLYCIGVFAKAYANTSLGIDLQFDTRNGPFFGSAFVATGYYLSFNLPKHSFRIGMITLFLGFILQMNELYLLYSMYYTSFFQDYTFGTYFFGLGVALIGFSGKLMNSKQFTLLAKYTLGIYLVHIMVIDFLGFIILPTNITQNFAFVLLVYIFSTLLVALYYNIHRKIAGIIFQPT
jgi:surface polysaccharide O-acyltransferase-like enzyme